MKKLIFTILMSCLTAGLNPAAAQDQSQVDRHEKMHARFEAMKKDCADDVQKFCSDAAHGPATGECLMKNKAQLSAACQKDLSQMHHHHPHGQEPKASPADDAAAK